MASACVAFPPIRALASTRRAFHEHATFAGKLLLSKALRVERLDAGEFFELRLEVDRLGL